MKCVSFARYCVEHRDFGFAKHAGYDAEKHYQRCSKFHKLLLSQIDLLDTKERFRKFLSNVFFHNSIDLT